MDLLLDSSLFQMEIRSLKHWRTIVDNLMSQDISTFRDLLGNYCFILNIKSYKFIVLVQNEIT